jgi:HEAT repeat protein
MAARVITVIVVLAVAAFITTAIVMWVFDDTGRLLSQCTDDSPYTRASAARQLGRSGSQRAYDSLIRLLHDEAPEVRITAAEALASLGNPRALRAVARTYKRDVGGPYDARYEKAIAALLEARKQEQIK